MISVAHCTALSTLTSRRSENTCDRYRRLVRLRKEISLCNKQLICTHLSINRIDLISISWRRKRKANEARNCCSTTCHSPSQCISGRCSVQRYLVNWLIERRTVPMDDQWQKKRSLMDELNKTRLAAERETIAVRLLMQVTESVGGWWFGYPWTERIITYHSWVALSLSSFNAYLVQTKECILFFRSYCKAEREKIISQRIK